MTLTLLPLASLFVFMTHCTVMFVHRAWYIKSTERHWIPSSLCLVHYSLLTGLSHLTTWDLKEHLLLFGTHSLDLLQGSYSELTRLNCEATSYQWLARHRDTLSRVSPQAKQSYRVDLLISSTLRTFYLYICTLFKRAHDKRLECMQIITEHPDARS